MIQLTEKGAEDFLEKQGFKVAKRAVVKDKSKLIGVINKIDFPWVMKASSSKIIHKAIIGGVIISLKNIEEATEAYEKLSKIKDFESVIIQETLSGVELIIGLKKTPEFSHVLMFGKGGSHVEEEKDVSFRVLPVSNKDIKEMMKETKVFLLLKERKVKISEVEKCLQKTAKLIKKNNKIEELDINPLFVNEKSAIVADARVLMGN